MDIITLDQEITVFLNGFHNTFFDSVMSFISNKYVWIPLYLLIIALFFKKCGREAIVTTLVAIAMIAATDVLTSKVTKPLVARNRPCHEIALKGSIHTVNDHCGGQYGYFSSHASNAFAFAVFSILFFKRKIYWLLIVWAAFNAYSRIYLGVHYLGDVLTGAAFGAIMGFLGYHCQRTLRNRIFKKAAS